uniref:THH1/TOM1/TOM3 domain-containing protein n=1 Tax=Globisporangium ultimum (strain ATCC 200006 / CBS 805.95 / DAOM BR144) TaxID=431595 RepID=K3WFC1_GLOUD
MNLWHEICVFGEGHCFYTWSAAASSVYCYAAALAYTVSVSIQRGRLGEHGHATHLLPVKRMRWFPTFLGFSYFTRIVWFLLSGMHAFEWVVGAHAPYAYEHMIIDVPILPTDIDIYVVGVTSFGKLATLLYFSAFTLLLRFWEDVLFQAQRADKPLARFAANQSVIAEYTRASKQQLRSRKLFVVANVWIYLVEFALLVVKTLFPTYQSTNFMFQLDYGVVALFFFLLAVMLARCAYKLRQVLLKIEFSALATSIATRVTWLGLAVSLLFLYRSVLLVISTPAIEVFDPHVSNPWLFYTIPEVLPGFLVIFMMSVKKQTPSAASGGLVLGHHDEVTPLLQRRFSSDPPRFHGQELHI